LDGRYLMTNVININRHRKPRPSWEHKLERFLDEAADCIADRIVADVRDVSPETYDKW
jgi:hypothetical protein